MTTALPVVWIVTQWADSLCDARDEIIQSWGTVWDGDMHHFLDCSREIIYKVISLKGEFHS